MKKHCEEIIEQIIKNVVENKPIDTLTWLSDYKTNKNATHVSYIGDKWKIPDNKYKDFLNIYIQNARKKQYLIERPTQFYPLIIDLDLLYESPKNETYVLAKIPKFIEIIVVVLDNIFENISTDVYICSKKGNWKKNGIHIYFPNVIANYEMQAIIRKKVLENDLKGLFKTINDNKDIYDIATCRKNPNGLAIPYSKKPNQTNIYRPTRQYYIYKNHIVSIRLSLIPDQLIPFCTTRTNKKPSKLKKQPTFISPKKEQKPKNNKLGFEKINGILNVLKTRIEEFGDNQSWKIICAAVANEVNTNELEKVINKVIDVYKSSSKYNDTWPNETRKYMEKFIIMITLPLLIKQHY